MLKIFAHQQKSTTARVFVPLDLAKSPYLDPDYALTSTALALLNLIAQYVKKDSAYRKRLRDHYRFVRTVAMDQKHPAHPALIKWATNGTATPASPGVRNADSLHMCKKAGLFGSTFSASITGQLHLYWL